MPGGVDVHTHLDMPFGGTVSADDYRTGTIAAAVGGTTTVIDFALQSRGHTMSEALKPGWPKATARRASTTGCTWPSPTLGRATARRAWPKWKPWCKQGISSFKLFMAYPNVLMIDDGLMFKVMHKAGTLNALCCVHAENGSVIDIVVARMLAEGKTAPHYHAHSRSTKAEAEATHRAIAIADMAGAAVYIVHLSNEDSLRELKHAQQRGLRALAETCPQYLVLSLEEQMPGKSWEEAKYVFTRRCAKSTTSLRCGKRWKTARLPWSPPTTAPSALPTRSRWAKTTSQRFPMAARASRTVCRSSGTSAWSGRAHAGEVCRALLHGAGTHLRHAAKGRHRAGQGRGYPALGSQRRVHHLRRHPVHGDRLLHVRRLAGVGQRQARLLPRRAGGERRKVDRADGRGRFLKREANAGGFA
jgi:hypothetical protein